MGGELYTTSAIRKVEESAVYMTRLTQPHLVENLRVWLCETRLERVGGLKISCLS